MYNKHMEWFKRASLEDYNVIKYPKGCIMLTIYIWNCIVLHKMILIGMKCELQEQLQFESFTKNVL